MSCKENRWLFQAYFWLVILHCEGSAMVGWISSCSILSEERWEFIEREPDVWWFVGSKYRNCKILEETHWSFKGRYTFSPWPPFSLMENTYEEEVKVNHRHLLHSELAMLVVERVRGASQWGNGPQQTKMGGFLSDILPDGSVITNLAVTQLHILLPDCPCLD